MWITMVMMLILWLLLSHRDPAPLPLLLLLLPRLTGSARGAMIHHYQRLRQIQDLDPDHNEDFRDPKQRH